MSWETPAIVRSALAILLSLGCAPHPTDHPTEPATAATRPTAPTSEQREQACRECDGVWEPRRLGGEFCNCRARDAGRTCHRGRDCEGECVPSDVEVTATEAEHEWVIPVGRCSERISRTSCRAALPYDEATAPVRRRKGTEQPLVVPTVCD